jgi:HSP20 family molecular chaperone IbpA
VEFETPGVNVENLVLRATPHALSLSFVKHPQGVDLKGARHQSERNYGNFFRIPGNADIT